MSRSCNPQMAIQIFESIVILIDFARQRFAVCAWERKSYEMNKCLSLVHLIRRIGPQSGGSEEFTSWVPRMPKT